MLSYIITETALAGSLLSKHTLILSHTGTHTITTMIPGNITNALSLRFPAPRQFFNEFFNSLYCLLMSPWFCSGTRLWKAEIMGFTSSLIQVWWMASAKTQFVCVFSPFSRPASGRLVWTFYCRTSTETFRWTTPPRGLRPATSSENTWRKMVMICAPFNSFNRNTES